MAKIGKGMLFPVEQTLVARDDIRAPLKTPAYEARQVVVFTSVADVAASQLIDPLFSI